MVCVASRYSAFAPHLFADGVLAVGEATHGSAHVLPTPGICRHNVAYRNEVGSYE